MRPKSDDFIGRKNIETARQLYKLGQQAMTMPQNIAPSRILFTMLRVSDLERSVAFYRDLLGMTEFERETFPEAKFTAVFLGYGNKDQSAVLELTYNWENNGYEQGTAFGNVSLAVNDVYALEAYLK